MALAAWQGFVGFYNSNDLTYASSIAFFALLSLFPLLLLSLSVLGMFTASDDDRAVVLDFVLRYFPRQFDFVTSQLDAFRQRRTALGIGGLPADGVGRARLLRRADDRRQLRVAGRAPVQLLEAQAGLVPDDGRGGAPAWSSGFCS